MVVRHAESFTISDYLTSWRIPRKVGGRFTDRTVHYAYMPCDNAILSLYELTMRNYQLQPSLRIMAEEISGGEDELGSTAHGPWTHQLVDGLTTGYPRGPTIGWWAQCDDPPSGAAVLGGVTFMMNHPHEGILIPDELPQSGDSGRRRPPLPRSVPLGPDRLDSPSQSIASLCEMGRAGGGRSGSLAIFELRAGTLGSQGREPTQDRYLTDLNASPNTEPFGSDDASRPGHPPSHMKLTDLRGILQYIRNPRKDLHPGDRRCGRHGTTIFRRFCWTWRCSGR